jgi:hypothetical protein
MPVVKKINNGMIFWYENGLLILFEIIYTLS